MQLALAEVLLLSAIAGVLGTQIVLRRLAFFTHGVGAAAFPGLVLAGPIGVPAQAAALATGAAFAGGLEGLRRRARIGSDAATALLLALALAGAVVLASDVFHSGAGVDQLLFGSLIGVTAGDLAVTAVAALLIGICAFALGRSWLATGFDEESAPTLGISSALGERVLVLALAVAVVVALDAAGALLVGALLVVPAATARLFARSVGSLQRGTAALAAAEGVTGLWLAYTLDVPPGPAIAVLGGLVFAAAAAITAVVGSRVR
jgi:manganese/iron transport system permease protein